MRRPSEIRSGTAGLLASDRLLVTIAVIGGLAIRLLWLFSHNAPIDAGGEAQHAAVGFARYGYISDVYGWGGVHGTPSAHLLPIPVIIAGSVLSVFGVTSPIGPLVLSAIAIVVVLASMVLLYAAFGRLGASRSSRLMALFGLCLLPFNPSLETIEFRYWEGGYAVLIAALFLLMVMRADLRGDSGHATVALLALLAALLFFVSPQLGVAAYLCLLLLGIRLLPARRWPATLLAAIGALAIFLVPWTIHNDRAMGEPILLRSNLGLEIALGFNDDALRPNRLQAFRDRLEEIHPDVSREAYLKMQAAGGEVAYFKTLRAATRSWIAAHPLETVRLAIRHVADFVFPPLWFWSIYTDTPGKAGLLKQGLFWAISAMAIGMALFAAARLGRRTHYACIMLFVPMAFYAMVQPVLRYHYVIFAVSVYFAAMLADLVLRLFPVVRRAADRLERGGVREMDA